MFLSPNLPVAPEGNRMEEMWFISASAAPPTDGLLSARGPFTQALINNDQNSLVSADACFISGQFLFFSNK